MTIVPDSKLSPIWEKALQNYREDLADDHLQTILETRSMEELMEDTKILQSLGPQGRKPLDSLNRLKPTYKLFNDFSAALVICFGAEDVLTGLIWGSIRMVLSLASATGDTLYQVLDMLDELSLTLPRLKSYKKTVSVDPELEGSLLEVYTEVICFYARTIYFFRSHNNVFFLQKSWSQVSRDFSRTIQRIKRVSETIESELELTRMRFDDQKIDQVLRLLASHDIVPQKSHYVPFMEDPRFWGREDILSQIDNALSMDRCGNSSLRSFALYGMGGVGKTQIALRYADTCRDKYDAVLWISADNSASIARSFREAAKALDLIQPHAEIEDNSVILKVKTWLSSTRIQWLLVFDNADDLIVLKEVWPGSSGGSVLLTSRDSTGAFGLASDGCQVQPFGAVAGSEALLNILGLDVTPENKQQASAIASVFGGLPLALNQIGGFIAQRKIPLQDFLPLYRRNSFSIDSKRTMNMNYTRTLATVWDTPLNKLSGDAQVLLKILAFLNPDNVRESLLKEGALHGENYMLQFAKNEVDFLDAQQVLLQISLIDKSMESGIMCMHKLVQKAVIRRMSSKEHQEIFSIVVDILTANLPDTYSADVSHQIASWAKCEKVVPHIESIVECNKEYGIFPADYQPLAEVLLRYCWFLYERENYSIAQSYVKMALQHFSDRNSLAYASAIDLQGLIDLDISRPIIALGEFEEAYKIRAGILSSGDAFLAASFVNIGLALTEMGKLDQAQEYLQSSIDIRLQHNSDRIGNPYSNMSSLLLRMGQANEAEEMLKCCPSLKDFTDETLLDTGNPRFSGDIFLLSRVRLAQGRYDESLNLASKAMRFRKQCLGNRLKVCDSLYQVANLHERRNNPTLSIQHLEECIKISEELPRIEGLRHLARANYKLSQILGALGKNKERTACLHRASAVREDIYKLDGDSPHGINDFESLVPWMLW